MRWLDERRFSQNPRERAFVQDPYACYRELHHAGGPVYWLEYGLWCLCSFEAVDRALRDRRLARLPASRTPPAWPPHLADFAACERHSLLALEPPTHTRLRRVVNGAFLARATRAMEGGITALCQRAIDDFAPRLQAGETVDLLDLYATPVPVTVIAELLGMPLSMSQQLLSWSHAMVRVYTGQQSHADELEANDAAADFVQCLQQQIAARRRQPADDLLSQMLDSALSEAEIVSLAVLLLNAGHEATVHQIGNATKSLLQGSAMHRSILRDVRTVQDVRRADAVVNEALRHDAPLHLFTRYAQCEIALDDAVTIAAGEQIALLLGAANHDPARFTDPARFDPERTDPGHVSFGVGTHFCVGASLARLELRIALATLLERLPTLALAEEPHYRDNYHFHGLERLPVTLAS